MGNAAGERGQRLDLAGLLELKFELTFSLIGLFTMGDVSRDNHHMGHRLILRLIGIIGHIIVLQTHRRHFKPSFIIHFMTAKATVQFLFY